MDSQRAIEFLKLIGVVFFAYLIFHAVQVIVVMPVEERFAPKLTQFASLVYLPHAVRVLAVAIVGPQAFFALFPAILVVIFVENQLGAGAGAIGVQPMLAAGVGAGCTVVAFYIVRRFAPRGILFGITLQNWRPVFAIGVVSSLLNSIGLAIVFREFFDPALFPQLLFKYFVGDVLGLVAGTLILLMCLKTADR